MCWRQLLCDTRLADLLVGGPRDDRSHSQIREHYAVERQLADRLRDAPGQARGSLYREVYEELFDRVPHHPQLRQKQNGTMRHVSACRQMSLLRRYLTPAIRFLEVGAGDCGLAWQVSKTAAQVFAVDVSVTIAGQDACPKNCTFVLSDGCALPMESGSMNLVYARDLIEHLHPDDAWRHVCSVYSVLASGGTYICLTPNRLSGPHDISRHFDAVARGLHLREYTALELVRLLRQAGFRHFGLIVGGRGVFLPTELPLWGLVLLERSLMMLPHLLPKPISRSLAFRMLLGVRIVARKPK
jgi:SAM-dependent methyltransferase